MQISTVIANWISYRIQHRLVRKPMLFFLLIMTGWVFSNCKKDHNSDFPFAGEPYLGNVRILIAPPGGSYSDESGTSSVHFVEAGSNHFTLVMFGDLGPSRDGVGFNMNGLWTGGVWASDDSTMVIGRDGKITGGGLAEDMKYTFSGSATATFFGVKVVIETLKETSGGLPKGTVVTFTYTMGRNAGADGSNDAPCDNIRWEGRQIATLGGGLQTITVPVCD